MRGKEIQKALPVGMTQMRLSQAPRWVGVGSPVPPASSAWEAWPCPCREEGAAPSRAMATPFADTRSSSAAVPRAGLRRPTRVKRRADSDGAQTLRAAGGRPAGPGSAAPPKEPAGATGGPEVRPETDTLGLMDQRGLKDWMSPPRFGRPCGVSGAAEASRLPPRSQAASGIGFPRILRPARSPANPSNESRCRIHGVSAGQPPRSPRAGRPWNCGVPTHRPAPRGRVPAHAEAGAASFPGAAAELLEWMRP